MIILFTLHALVNMGVLICNLIPGFWPPIGFYGLVAAAIGLFGEINGAPFEWFTVIHIEAYAGLGFAVFTSIVINSVKLLNFMGIQRKVSEQQRIKSLFNPNTFTYEFLLWTIGVGVLYAADIFGFHFLTVTRNWIFGLVVGLIGIGEFVAVFLVTSFIVTQNTKKRFIKDNKKYTLRLREIGVWYPEILVFAIQPLLFKIGLLVSYLGFHKNNHFIFHPNLDWRIVATERVSIFIAFGVYIVLNIILLVVKSIFKAMGIFPETIRLAPENRHFVSKKDILLGSKDKIYRTEDELYSGIIT